jgi:probable phosphoglycerate mutase
MILKKEFYFIRHGQTDHNLRGVKEDHPPEIPLNDTGRMQAKEIEPLIASLPVKIVCSSPFRRAQETKEIITANLDAIHHEFEDLGECTSKIWFHMSKRGMYAPLPEDGPAREFMERVRRGINQALALPGPILIVSHGGVHWALCCLMGIEEHHWSTQNCTPIHFSIEPSGKWIAKKLI